ncbi:MAG: HD domain-containing protein [Acidimicrobiia bacterium]|nr:HD domain-containing protein [Acidimicrobiia bacterium]
MAGAGRPDPQRLGGVGWLERTNGALTARERRRLLGAVVWGQALALVGRVKLATGRVPASIPGEDQILDPPDSALARAADEACAEQPDELAGHARRTWIYGRALAVVDDTELDPELFYVAALLHDVGLVEAVAGEDFTLRSGQLAARCLRAHGHDEPTIDLVRDAISAHVTPGATLATDGPLGYYVQAGAVLDLVGLRACDLSAALLDRALRAHQRAGLTPAIIDHVNSEAAAVPDGRFALLTRLGFTLAIRLAPFDQK